MQLMYKRTVFRLFKSCITHSLALVFKGQAPDPDYPVDIWFDSLKSVAELAALTGRAVSYVSRTLKTLDGLGVVRLVSSGYAKTKK